MGKLRRVIIAVGICACLFILLFPPVRSPDANYSHLKIVGGRQAGNGWVADGRFEAVQISRFSAFEDVATTQDYGPLRVEVDAGELLRELALIVVLLIAADLYLPSFVVVMRGGIQDMRAAPPSKT